MTAKLYLFPHSGEMHATAPHFISLINHRRKSRVVEVFLIAARESETKTKCFAREKATNSCDEAIVRDALSSSVFNQTAEVTGAASARIRLAESEIISQLH